MPTTPPAFRGAVNLFRRYARLLNSQARRAQRELLSKRALTDVMLAQLCEQSEPKFSGEVLIDAQWDNPNYWTRVSLLRAAIGLPNGREVGLLGSHRRRECSSTLDALGINTRRSFDCIHVDMTAIRRDADRLLSTNPSPADIIDWELPGGVPGALLYDGILKRQQLASVDTVRPDFRPLLIEGLCGIARARNLLDEHDFQLVVISHPLNFTYGAVAHQALCRGIPVILPFGLFGVSRMTYMRKPEELTSFYDRPTRAEIDALTPDRAATLAAIGREYLERRFDGCADDLASVYAYRKCSGPIDRDAICRYFAWDPDKPIVGFYASNWYDWPHQLGMTQFRDFLDWTESTFNAAVENTSVNWLFKPHPCEYWFGGVALEDILARMSNANHIGVADKAWNNTAVMASLDSLVTYHGTAGIEFASLGMPVLVPDRGKYDDCGFVKVASNRADYLRLLGLSWWDDMDMEACKLRAEIFAGWWFCAPSWQQGFLLPDDSQQDALYDIIPTLLSSHTEEVMAEILHLRKWIESGHRYSHTFKMMSAESFRLTNV